MAKKKVKNADIKKKGLEILKENDKIKVVKDLGDSIDENLDKVNRALDEGLSKVVSGSSRDFEELSKLNTDAYFNVGTSKSNQNSNMKSNSYGDQEYENLLFEFDMTQEELDQMIANGSFGGRSR